MIRLSLCLNWEHVETDAESSVTESVQPTEVHDESSYKDKPILLEWEMTSYLYYQ